MKGRIIWICMRGVSSSQICLGIIGDTARFVGTISVISSDLLILYYLCMEWTASLANHVNVP